MVTGSNKHSDTTKRLESTDPKLSQQTIQIAVINVSLTTICLM